jgi:hypothetical protein
MRLCARSAHLTLPHGGSLEIASYRSNLADLAARVAPREPGAGRRLNYGSTVHECKVRRRSGRRQGLPADSRRARGEIPPRRKGLHGDGEHSLHHPVPPLCGVPCGAVLDGGRGRLAAGTAARLGRPGGGSAFNGSGRSEYPSRTDAGRWEGGADDRRPISRETNSRRVLPALWVLQIGQRVGRLTARPAPFLPLWSRTHSKQSNTQKEET